MKIIQIIGSLGNGGAEKTVLNNDLMFKEYGYDSKIVVLHEKDYYNTDAHEIINLNVRKSKAKKPLKKLLLNEKPSLILAHMQDMGRVLKRLKWDNIYNVVHTDIYERMKNDGWWKRFKKLKDYYNIYSNTNIITVSEGIKQNFANLNIPVKSITTVYNPFDRETIIKLSNEKEIKENYICYAGSLRKVKRLDVLLKAFSMLGDKNLKLFLVGEGKEKENLQKLAESLNIAQRVKFIPWQKNIYPYIKHAKLTVLSSEAEGLSNLLVESLILNTPAVSTDCNSGPREILTSALSEFLAEVNNPEDLSRKMQKALKEYPEITSEYYDKFLKENIILKYKKLLQG